MSNRVIRPHQPPLNAFQKKVMVSPTQLATPKYSLQPFAVSIKNAHIFSHLKVYFEEKNVEQSWFSYCDEKYSFRKLPLLEKYLYYPQHVYSMQEGDCSKVDSEVAQKIFSINLRNLVIEGKKGLQEERKLKKHLIYGLMSFLPLYLLLLACCTCFSGKRTKTEVS